MKFNSRIVTTVLCAALALPTVMLSSCDGKNEPVKTKATNVYRYETLYESSYNYNSENIEDRFEINNLYGVGDSLIVGGYIYDKDWRSTEVYYDLDPMTGEMTEITIPAVNQDIGEYRNYTTFADDGSVWYIVNSGYYDEETQMYVESSKLCHGDTDGTVTAEADLYELLGVEKNGETYLYVNAMAFVDGKLYLSIDGSGKSGILSVSDDLASVETIPIDNMAYSFRMLPGDGEMLICYYTQTDYKQVVVSYDTATGALSQPLGISSKAGNNLYNAMASDTYDFVYKTNIGIYGYDIVSDTETELLNWINSDINATRLNSTYIAPDGTVFTLMQEYEESNVTTTINRLTRIPDEEVKEKYILTFGTLSASYNLIDAVVKFNRQSEDYRITIKNYADYNSEENEWKGAITQFNNDITTGKIPDIIQISSEMPYQNYAAKGLFADLYPLLDADPAFDRANLYENVLEALSVGGKLYQIIPSFRISTLAGKSSIVGGEDGWTMEGLLAALETLPEGVTDPFGGEMTRVNFLTNVCTMARDQFIDKDTGTCSFDSEEFIKILKFAAQLPEKTVWETTNWDEVGEDFYNDRDFMYRTDSAILQQMELGNYIGFWETQMGRFGADISLVGYPNANKNGAAIIPGDAFAISSQSQSKEGAWDFISNYICVDQDKEADSLYRFSIFRSVNRKMADYALAYHDDYWYEKQYGTLPDDGGYGVVEEVMPALPVVEEIPVEEEIVVEETAAVEIAVEKIASAPAVAVPASVPVDIDGDGIIDGEAPGGSGTEPTEKKRTWSFWCGGQTFDMGMMTEEGVAHVDRFLESISQVYQHDSAMMDIILEEASAFFAGQKSAEEVAKLIQNRVFIYVNESR